MNFANIAFKIASQLSNRTVITVKTVISACAETHCTCGSERLVAMLLTFFFIYSTHISSLVSRDQRLHYFDVSKIKVPEAIRIVCKQLGTQNSPWSISKQEGPS